MRLLKRLTATRWFQVAVGVLAAEYLRLVWKTNRFIVDPPDGYERIDADLPVIVVFWHGQHLMTPFLSRKHRGRVIISRHRDGEINAIVAERLGLETIRGSGSHSGDFFRKGGPRAFRAMLQALEQGYNVGSTADVPKVARVAGLGIVKLAAASGRPIFPVAIVTSRYKELNSWDRCVINLPFGRGAIVWEGPIKVPADADDAMLEAARQEIEASVNRVTERAYVLVARSARVSAHEAHAK